MPKMTGIQLARELTGIRSDIPVILCTGFTEAVVFRRKNADCLSMLLLRMRVHFLTPLNIYLVTRVVVNELNK